MELQDKTLYISMFIIPEFQRNGYGAQVLRDVIGNKFNLDFDCIKACIRQKILRQSDFLPISPLPRPRKMTGWNTMNLI